MEKKRELIKLKSKRERVFRRIIIFSILVQAMSCTTTSKEFASSILLNIKKKSIPGSIDARYYKKVDNKQLQFHIFYPDGYDKNREKPYPVALSFHGGAWTQGPIEWGYNDAQYFTSLGFIGIAVEYRLAVPGTNSVLDSIKDANSAVRWTRVFAKDFNIDPDKVLVIGHSSGGHLSISTAMFPQIKEQSENSEISSIPNIVWAYAPAVDLANDSYFQSLLKGREKSKNYSPIDNIQKGLPPMNIIHGTADELLSVNSTRKFVKEMKNAGNSIFYREYESGTHGFFYEDPAGRLFCRKLINEQVKASGWLE